MSESSVCQPEGSEFEFYLPSQTNPTTNSLVSWLTARRHGLAGNGQYWGNPALSSLPGLPVGLPKSPLPGLSGCASQSLRRGVRVWLTAFRFGTRRAVAIGLTGQIHVSRWARPRTERQNWAAAAPRKP